MRSSPIPPEAPPVEPFSQHERDEYEAFIESRLRKTRRQVKAVDIATHLLALAIGVLAYLLSAAVVDHWLITGGLGFVGRFLLMLGLVLGAGCYFTVQLLPLLMHRINPIFAAHTIERSRPALKNGLVNLLFLRRERQDVPRSELALRIYRGMEERAAAELADPSVEMAVDRSGVIRLGYALAGVLAVCALYLALSPKDPLVSFRRVAWPWAEIQAPTRVTITDIRPGDTTAFQGDMLSVSAEVRGVKPDEPVTLYFTTADGQSVDQAIPLTVPNGQYRYRCQLPPGSLGLQQDLQYRLTAGDAESKTFQVRVEVPLTIPVDNVYYDYPEYTGIPDRSSPSGDLRAIEGTNVTIEATASKPIERAVIELNCDPRNTVPMTAEGRRATGRFTLRLNPTDPALPQFSSYQLRFRDASGRENPRPIRHEISVIADLPPDIRLVDPPDDSIQLPVDGFLDLEVQAKDPDFALRRVSLRAERDGRSLPIAPLLDRPKPEQPYEGPFVATCRFEPSKLKLKPGDEIAYWAEADDNKEPLGNHSETQRRSITIVAPQTEGERQPEGKAAGQPQAAEEKPARDQPQEQPDNRAGKEPMQEQPGEQQEKRDPEQQAQQDQQSKQSEDRQPPDEQGSAGAGQGQDGSQERGGKQPSEKQQAQQQDGQQSGQSQQGDRRQPGNGGQSARPPENAEPGDQSGQGLQPRRNPIDDKTNPGEAFEEILEHRREQQKQQKQQPVEQPGPSDQQPPGQQPPAQDAEQPGQRAGRPQEAAKPGATQKREESQQPGEKSGEQPPPGKPQPTGEKQPSGDPQLGDKPPAGGDPHPSAEKTQAGEHQQHGQSQPGDQPDMSQQPKDGQSTSAAEPKQAQRVPDAQMSPELAPADQKPQEGQGAQSADGGKPDKDALQPGQAEPRPDAKGGDPHNPQGDPGAGKPSDDGQGTPSPQEANRPRDKKPDMDSSEPTDEGASSPSTSPKDSDSRGEDPGDRSGGGGKGGGQQANQPGTGNPGSNTTADQGAEPSNQQGEGETGNKGGDQTKADRPTGKPGSESGEPGSGSREQPDQSAGGGTQPSSQQPGGGSDQAQRDGQPGGQPSGGQNTSAAGNPTQGGVPGEQNTPATPPESSPLGADDPNLDYANKQTDLALEHLKDQLAKENPELLERLGWDRNQAEDFVRNWEKMKREAARPDDRGQTARKDLRDALRSLGLRPRGTELEGGRSKTDQLRNLREGRRFDPPPEWRDLFRAYNKGLSEAQRPANEK